MNRILSTVTCLILGYDIAPHNWVQTRKRPAQGKAGHGGLWERGQWSNPTR